MQKEELQMTKGWMGCKGFLAVHRRFAVLLAVETLCILALMVRCAKPLYTEQLDLAQLTAVNVPEGTIFSVQDGALVVDTTGTSAENGAVLLTAESPTVVLPSDAYEITVSYDSDQWKLDEEPITLNFVNQGMGEVISGGSDLWGGTNLLTLDGAHHSVTGRIWVKQGNTRGFTVKLQAQMAAQTVIQNITFTAKRAYRVMRLLVALLVFAVLDAVLLLFFERLDFETAALLRDQIMAIDRVAAGQKVVMENDTEMDVIALAGTTHAVCAAVLRYRDGRLTDKREFLFRDTTDINAVREEFLPQYYLDGGAIPKTIAVDALPPDADALSEALNQARGTKVELYVPQRGDVAKLVTMAYTNAVERLGRESGRYTREEKLLEEAAQVLGLKKPPRVIESYDISNWGDGSSVCGMVVFRDGRPHRAGYRRFKMKTVAGTDDYASLAETLSRRAAEYEMARRGEKPDGPQNQFATLPDLLLIDGGRGQVGAVKQALRGTALEHVPTFGMVKDDHHRTRAIVDDEGGEIAINRHRNIFTFVTNIQDETHRYANDYRKRAMKKKSYAATLTAIPGVGEKTSAALLAHFKTVSAVKAASISDLEEVKGISHAKAEILYNALRNGV